MLDAFKHIKSNAEFDTISFTENLKDPTQTTINWSTYINPGTKVDQSELGDKYHIFLYRQSSTNPNRYDNFELFEAILTDPLEYLSGIIPHRNFGMIAKKTTTSGEYVQEVVDKLTKLDYTITVF
jgi:hypothetical protein